MKTVQLILYAEYENLIAGTLKDVQVCLVQDVHKCCIDTIETTGFTICNMRITNSKITSFIHPISEQIIETAENYNERKILCDKLYQLYNTHSLYFKNQSFANMAKSVFENIVGNVMKSCSTKYDNDITDKYHTAPMINTFI